MKYIWILVIGLFLQFPLSAQQIDEKSLQEELEKMQLEMQKQLENMGFSLEGFNFQMDTLFFENFTMPGIPDTEVAPEELQRMMEESFQNLDWQAMMKSLENQLEQLDLSQLENLLDSMHQQQLFIFPPVDSTYKQKKKRPVRRI